MRGGSFFLLVSVVVGGNVVCMYNSPTIPAELPAYVATAVGDGSATSDPYGFAISLIGVSLAHALDGGVSDNMSQGELETLTSLAEVIYHQDPMSYAQFMARLGPR